MAKKVTTTKPTKARNTRPDPMEIPKFMRRTGSDAEKARIAKAWEKRRERK